MSQIIATGTADKAAGFARLTDIAPTVVDGNSVAATYATTYTLSPNVTGTTVLFNTAAGNSFTLPSASGNVGLSFDFFVLTSCTSNAHDILCAGSDKMVGAVSTFDGGSATPGGTPGPKVFLADGTHVKVSMTAANSNAKGGIKGTWLRVTAITSTQWQVSGIVVCGSGSTIATPFST